MKLRYQTLNLAVALTLGLINLITAPESATGRAPVEQGMEELTAAWRDSLAAWVGETDAVKRERAAEFFGRISVADAASLCSAARGDTLSGAESAGAFLEAKMRIAPFEFGDLVVLLDFPDLHASCQKTIIRHIGLMKDELSQPQREAAAEALLKIADSDGQTVVVRNQLEIAAAELSVSDDVLKRMIAYVDSRDEEIRFQGFSMMMHSGDGRADDLLFERMRVLKADGEFPAARLLILLGASKGRKAFDTLASFYNASSDQEYLHAATQGMAHSGDPRFMAILLDLYNDRVTGIRDATSEIEDRIERGRYYHLWHLTRVMEPTIIEALNGDDRELSRQALELIDRQSRFGMPANPTELADALRIARERAAGDVILLDHLDQIGARFETHERAQFERGRLSPSKGGNPAQPR